MFAYLTQGALLGIFAGSQPGPLQAFFLAESIKRGWRGALPAAAAPLLSDGPIILTVLFLLSRLPDAFLVVLRLGGGAFILYLAVQAFRAVLHGFTPLADTETANGGSILRAALLNLLNPNPWLFWGTIGGPTLAEAWAARPSLAVAYIAGFFVVFITLNMVLIVVFGTAGRADERLQRGLMALSGVALLGFGVYQIVSGIGLL
jgi:threonine/homoserine/homoserine lactone efflux protein